MCNYGITFLNNLFDKDRLLVIKISDELDIPLVINVTRIGFMSQVPMQKDLVTCKHAVIASHKHW